MSDKPIRRVVAREYWIAVAATGVSSAVCFAMYPFFELTNLVMVYLIGTLVVAIRGHRGPAALSSALGVLCFDVFFVPPRFRLTVADAQYILTFAVMFAAAMTISHLTIRLREKAQAAEESEQRSVWLMEKAKKAEIEAESERLRSSLLSSVSHDLRTPLAAIRGSIETLLTRADSLTSGDARALLEGVQSENERLSHLVQNLLDATRLESGSVHIEKELYAFEDVIGSALERLKTVLNGRETTVEIPENLPLIPMDVILVEQVLINLLENAVRHTPDKSRIEVSIAAEKDSVTVAVADEGSGLRAEDLEHVFDKFYHGQASPGAGLGLSICRAVVQAHGGRIWAENRPEKGAIFRFTLPLGEANGH